MIIDKKLVSDICDTLRDFFAMIGEAVLPFVRIFLRYPKLTVLTILFVSLTFSFRFSVGITPNYLSERYTAIDGCVEVRVHPDMLRAHGQPRFCPFTGNEVTWHSLDSRDWEEDDD